MYVCMYVCMYVVCTVCNICTVNKIDHAILKIADEITKIPRTVKKILSYLQKWSFFSSKSFLIFGGSRKVF